MALGILGDAASGGHQAVLTDVLDPLSNKELSRLVLIAEACAFGPVTGLARASHCLSAVSTSPSPLCLQRHVADILLRNLEPTRLGTEFSSRSMIGYSFID